MTTLKEIRNKIKEKLDTLTWTWQPFDFIYKYHTLDNAWYPYVSFEPSILISDYEDNCNNTRKYTFDIFIYQEFENVDRERALDILIDAHESVISLFEIEYDLDWTVTQIRPLNSVFSQVPWVKWKVLFNNIQMEVEYLSNTK